MSLSHFDYDLPSSLIAQEPLPHRSDARLLVVDRSSQSFQHRTIRDLPEFIEPSDCLVLNNTKVIPARLMGIRSKTGGRWEGLFLQPSPPNRWCIIGKTKGKIEPGERVQLKSPNGADSLQLQFIAQQDDHTWIVEPEAATNSPFDILDRVGWTPIPPYIRKGKPLSYDKERYQTIFAAHAGSIAAPTAGLHFTPELIQTVKQKGTSFAAVTLHVGMGTFKPITAENIDSHHMHSEWCSLPRDSASILQQCRSRNGRIIAIGTTTVRVLESASATCEPFEGTTSLFIRPPYQFQNVDVLLTNFHFPKSTLLILVRTFGGDKLIQEAYREAVREEYRFFSYGDAMLIL